MPHLLQEALPDTLALPACQGLDLDQVAPSHTNVEGGLFLGRVSGNHDNMGCFLVTVETYGVGTWQSWPGHSMWGLVAHPAGPVSWSGGALCLPMAKAPVSRAMLILSPWEGGRRAGGA